MVGVQSFRKISKSSLRALLALAFVVFSTLSFGGFALSSTAFGATTETNVTIGFTPSSFLSAQSPAEISTKVTEFSSLVQKKTGIKVTPYVAISSADLVQKLKDGKVDFAFMSALNFVEAETKTKLKVLLKKVWDQGYYHSVFAVKSNSKIRKMSDLKGQRIAFVETDSASGYLYPSIHLNEIGLKIPTSFKSVVYSGSHEKSVELLRSNLVDVIAVFSNDQAGRDSAWTTTKDKKRSVRNEFRVVWSSAAIPNDPFCVRDEFYERNPKVAHELMFGLIEMNEDPTVGPQMRELLGVRGLMVATSQQYEPVRKMFRSLPKSEIKP